MPNYYELNRYPRYAITGFAGARSTLVRAGALTEEQARTSPLLASYDGPGGIDLLYRFATQSQGMAAMGFRRIERRKGEPEFMYALVYLAPSLEPKWRKAMDRAWEDYPLRADAWERFDVLRKGDELRAPSAQGQWKWAFYLRVLVFAIENHVEHWCDIAESDWQVLLQIADHDVADLPASRRPRNEDSLTPVLVPVTEEMQDAFDDYCGLDVNNRIVPAHVEAEALLRLWRANHPKWFRHIAFKPDEVFSKYPVGLNIEGWNIGAVWQPLARDRSGNPAYCRYFLHRPGQPGQCEVLYEYEIDERHRKLAECFEQLKRACAHGNRDEVAQLVEGISSATGNALILLEDEPLSFAVASVWQNP